MGNETKTMSDTPQLSDTPRTDERLAWCSNDARYKAPEQAFDTVVEHVGVMADHARALERELAALRAGVEMPEMADLLKRLRAFAKDKRNVECGCWASRTAITNEAINAIDALRAVCEARGAKLARLEAINAEVGGERDNLATNAKRWRVVRPMLTGDDTPEANAITLAIAAGLMRNETIEQVVDGLIAEMGAGA